MICSINTCQSLNCEGHICDDLNVHNNADQNADIISWHVKFVTLNPLSPHDALKHHFTFLKTDLISLQPRVLE